MKIENFDNVKKLMDALAKWEKRAEQLKELFESLGKEKSDKYFRVKIFSKNPFVDETKIAEISPINKIGDEPGSFAYDFLVKYQNYAG